MPHRALRIAVVASTLLVTSAIAIAFLAAPEIGSAYVMVVSSSSADLPRVTALVSLPLLRIGPGDPHERPVTSTWVALVWLVIAAIPLVVAAWTLRAPSPDAALLRWVVGYSVFAPLTLIVFLVAAAGLALPIACL